jgi:hypothetical protein
MQISALITDAFQSD